MSLEAELDAFRSEFMAQVSPEIRDAMVRADMELAASGIAQEALKAGRKSGAHVLGKITQLGATLVAVSPQTPDESLLTAEKNALAFPVLSDIGSTTAKSFGIAYDLAEELLAALQSLSKEHRGEHHANTSR